MFTFQTLATMLSKKSKNILANLPCVVCMWHFPILKKNFDHLPVRTMSLRRLSEKDREILACVHPQLFPNFFSAETVGDTRRLGNSRLRWNAKTTALQISIVLGGSRGYLV